MERSYLVYRFIRLTTLIGFHLSAVVNSAAVNMCVYLCESQFLILWCLYLGVEFAGLHGILGLALWRNLQSSFTREEINLGYQWLVCYMSVASYRAGISTEICWWKLRFSLSSFLLKGQCSVVPSKDSHQLQDGIFTWEASVLWQVDRAENPVPPGIPRPIQVSHLNSVSLYSRRYGCPWWHYYTQHMPSFKQLVQKDPIDTI